MKTERIKKLADILDAEQEAVDAAHSDSVRRFGFNMANYAARNDTDVEGHHCGTVACVAGWAVASFGVSGRAKKVDPRRLFTPGRLSFIHKTAEELLGLSKLQSGDLFLGTNIPYNHITPGDAAVTLRKLAETGEVDWSHVKERHDAEWGAA